jgi:hypothetical protein
MPDGLGWVVWFVAAGAGLLNLWLVLRFVSFMRTVETLLFDIERHTAKNAGSKPRED